MPAPAPASLARRLDTAFQRALTRHFERRFGVETTGRVDLAELGKAGSERIYYAGAHWVATRRALRALDPGPDDVFVDLGAGKGRVLALAAELPFARVIGVELAPELADVARSNVASLGSRARCRQIDVVTSDALEWPVPDDLSVVYLNCPFVGGLCHDVFGRLFESFDRRPRPLRIVYCHPSEHNWLIQSGRVTVTDVRAGRWPPTPGWWKKEGVIVTYRVGESAARPRVPRRRRRAVRHWSGTNSTRFAFD